MGDNNVVRLIDCAGGISPDDHVDLLALNDGQALYDAAAAGAAAQGLSVTWTVDDCVVLLATSDVSAERPWPSAEGPGVFARLGVQLHQQSEALA